MSKTAVLISTGEELLTGETTDTNSAWLAGALWEKGFSVRRMLTTGDDLESLVWALSEASRTASLVICTGGLGPTVDDRTAEAVAVWAGVDRQESLEALEQIAERYARMGRLVSDTNRKQAFLPVSAQILENRWGSAPGFSVSHDGTTVFCLPGVPIEMRKIFEAHISHRLNQDSPIHLHRIRTFGIAESRLQSTLSQLDIAPAELGFRAHIPEVQIKLRFGGDVASERRLDVVDRVVDALGDAVYNVDGGDLAETVVQRLRAASQTVSFAESCTAGITSGWIADVPGASAVLLESVVVYSNEAKSRLAGVPESTIKENGAVSEAVARSLAEGLRQRSGSTWAVGITGIAGPGGGSEMKPVGTVHIAVAGPIGTEHRHAVIPGSRQQIRKRAAGAALALILACAGQR